MCQASVYLISRGEEEEGMRDVLFLKAKDGHLLLTDFLVNEKELPDMILSIDFSEDKVVIEGAG